jgi:hypothetical protein
VRAAAVLAAAASELMRGGSVRIESGVGAEAAGREVRLTEAGGPGGDVRAVVAALATPGALAGDAAGDGGSGDAAPNEAAASTARAVAHKLRLGTSSSKLRGRPREPGR